MGSGIRAMGTDSAGRGGRSDGMETIGSARVRRGGERGRRGGGRGYTSRLKKSMEDEHMQGLLVEQEDLRQKQEKEHQDKLDEEALQQAREEDLMFERMDLEKEREKQQWEAMMDPLNNCRFPDEEESMDVEMYNITKASINFMVNTHESITHGQPSS
uniref:Splicing factor n=1 Tax=Tanacetum cinerariifolium TaxID=118510 RepID=A0A6L2KWK0_TANCI|nr:splicing factor [Tanacetum cinerariifolium]